jgi:hypothetical protein
LLLIQQTVEQQDGGLHFLRVNLQPSVITSKPAIHDHLKTGQRGLSQDRGFVVP